MGIGTLIRHAAGPLEPALTRAYRGFFFNLPGFADRLSAFDLLPHQGRMIEIGCGEGALLGLMVRRRPDAELLGADPGPHVGRSLRNSLACVTVLRGDATALRTTHRGLADLVVLCDVLHHIDACRRRETIAAAADLLRPGGHLVIKEWMHTRSPIFWLGWISDRFITGDRVTYQRAGAWMDEAAAAAGQLELLHRWCLRPWRCNQALVFQSLT